MKFTRDPKRNTIIQRFTQKEKADLIEFIIWNQVELSGLVQMVAEWIQSSKDHHQKISKINSENWRKKGSTKKAIQIPQPTTQTQQTDENNNEEENQIQYAEFVKMSESEHEKLVRRYWWKAVKEMIENFNNRVAERPDLKERKKRIPYRTISNRLLQDSKKTKVFESPKAREIRIENEKRNLKAEEQETKEQWKDRMTAVWFTS